MSWRGARGCVCVGGGASESLGMLRPPLRAKWAWRCLFQGGGGGEKSFACVAVRWKRQLVGVPARFGEYLSGAILKARVTNNEVGKSRLWISIVPNWLCVGGIPSIAACAIDLDFVLPPCLVVS